MRGYEKQLSEYLWVEPIIQQIFTEHPPLCDLQRIQQQTRNEMKVQTVVIKTMHSIREITLKARSASSQSRLAFLCGKDGKDTRPRNRHLSINTGSTNNSYTNIDNACKMTELSKIPHFRNLRKLNISLISLMSKPNLTIHLQEYMI